MNRTRVIALLVLAILIGIGAWLLRGGAEPVPNPPSLPPIPIPVAPPPPREAVPSTVPAAVPDPLPPPPAPVPRPAKPRIVVVRNARDGLAVAGLDLLGVRTLVREGEEAPAAPRETRTDSLGQVEVDREHVLRIPPSNQEWTASKGLVAEWGQMVDELWVHRTLSLLATVEVEGDDGSFDAEPVRGSFVPPLREVPPPDREGGLAEHSFLLTGDLSPTLRPEGGRRLRVAFPDLGRGSLVFTRAGWIGALVPLEGLSAGTEHRVVLRFRRAVKIRGVLRDDTGRPLEDRRITVYTTRKGKFADADPDGARELGRITGCGVKMALSQGKDTSRLTLVSDSTTGKDGAFEASVHQDGETVLVLWVEGLDPLARSLGHLREDRDLGTLTASRALAADTVRLLLDGSPLAGGSLTLTDFRFPDAQPAVSLSLDREGRIPASWLTRGGEYGISFRKAGTPVGPGKWTSWNGESVLDLSTMRKVTDVLTERSR